MNRSVRVSLVACLVGLGVLTTARPAPAQFGVGFGTYAGARFPGYGGLPLFNYGQQLNIRVGGFTLSQGYNAYGQHTSIGLGSFSFSEGYYGAVGAWMANRVYGSPYASSAYYPSSYGSYMSGGAGGPGMAGANRDFARAQRQAAAVLANPVAARNSIYDQWAYEKLGVTGLPALKPGQEMPAGLVKALAATSEGDVASGEALNHLMVAIVATENKGGAKGGKIDSAYLPPNLLDEVRFSGTPTADAVNLLRRPGKLNIPAVFNDGPLADIRPALAQDFADAAAPVLIGKSADPTKVGKLAASVKKAREILDPLTRNLEFEDATAARRFLNQLDTAVTVLRGSGTASLIDPRWSTEGTNVADLVKYMTKNKLLFGGVAKGTEDAYLALHHGLAGYLYVLGERLKPAPKKS